jgi:hypothetical protein
MYFTFRYENGTVRPVEIIQGNEGRRRENDGGGDSN